MIQKNNNFSVNHNKSNKSGGEFQKVMILRTLLSNKDILIFDEPSSFLDKDSKEILVNEIEKLSSNAIILIITHDSIFDTIAKNIYFTMSSM